MEVKMTPSEIAQRQLDAYNARDIDRFCLYFSDQIRVFNGRTNELLFEGGDVFKARYVERFKTPNLHCTLISRIAMGNIVIDHESVLGIKEGEAVEVIAFYTIDHEEIVEVKFFSP